MCVRLQTAEWPLRTVQLKELRKRSLKNLQLQTADCYYCNMYAARVSFDGYCVGTCRAKELLKELSTEQAANRVARSLNHIWTRLLRSDVSPGLTDHMHEQAAKACTAAIKKLELTEQAAKACAAAKKLELTEQAAKAAAKKLKLTEQAAKAAAKKLQLTEQAAKAAAKKLELTEQAAKAAAKKLQLAEQAAKAAAKKLQLAEQAAKAAAKKLQLTEQAATKAKLEAIELRLTAPLVAKAATKQGAKILLIIVTTSVGIAADISQFVIEYEGGKRGKKTNSLRCGCGGTVLRS